MAPQWAELQWYLFSHCDGETSAINLRALRGSTIFHKMRGKERGREEGRGGEVRERRGGEKRGGDRVYRN